MAGIGEDIKEVLNELGTSAIIRRLGGSVFEEKADIESFPEHSSEFIRQFFCVLTLSFDTAAVNGDTLEIKSQHYIATNILPSYFEDAVVDHTSALYKCNVNGVLKRPVLEPASQANNYVPTNVFNIIYPNPDNINALEYENKYNAGPLFAEDAQSLLRERHVLVLPAGLEIEVGDRWYPDYEDETVYYRVEQVDIHRLSNCPICSLAEDTR